MASHTSHSLLHFAFSKSVYRYLPIANDMSKRNLECTLPKHLEHGKSNKELRQVHGDIGGSHIDDLFLTMGFWTGGRYWLDPPMNNIVSSSAPETSQLVTTTHGSILKEPLNTLPLQWFRT